MSKFVLKIFNLNDKSLQIRSKQRAASASIKQRRTSFELSEFQFVTLKLTYNLRVHEPQIRIVHHDHSAVITWFATHMIMHGLKRGNLRKRIFQLKIQPFVFMENSTKQFVLIAKGILKLNDSQTKTIAGLIITYIRVEVRDVSRRLAHEAKADRVDFLALWLLIFF
jgi:hypothetical protein